MTKNQQQETLSLLFERLSKITADKGDDYASGDRLSNFKLAGEICQITPSQQCLSLIATKVARLGSLLKDGRKAKNESIDDSVIDLMNYAALLYMIINEDKINESNREVHRIEENCRGTKDLFRNTII